MKGIMISVRLSQQEYNTLDFLAKEADISKAEYLRLIIQGIGLGKAMSEGKKANLNIGGYGYSFKPEEMEQLFQEVGEKLMSAVEIKPVIGNKSVRYKRIKTRKKVA